MIRERKIKPLEICQKCGGKSELLRGLCLECRNNAKTIERYHRQKQHDPRYLDGRK
jgi:hypothetical protein